MIAKLAHVRLRPMRPEEFTTFRETFVEDWAKDLAKVENIPLDRARQQAERRTDADLKDGLDTERRRIRAITVDGSAVGTLWFSFGAGRAFLDDITIGPEFRGNGYGQRALELMEAELQALGVGLVQLNVYAHNPRARALYEKLGYAVTGVKMSKRIQP